MKQAIIIFTTIFLVGCGDTITPESHDVYDSLDAKILAGLTVELSEDTPVSMYLLVSDGPYEFTRMKIFNYGSTSEEITGLRFHHYGPGALKDFKEVWIALLSDGLPIAPGQPYGELIPSAHIEDNFGEFIFDVPFQIESGATITLSLWGVLTDSAHGNQGALGLESPDDIFTSADVNGDFPIIGNMMAFVSN